MNRSSVSGNPLRLSLDRVWLYGTLCAVLASLPFLLLPWFHIVAYSGDFANYWAAGSTVGTPSLMNHALHSAWQTAHGLNAEPFVYFPAFAWLYAPLSHQQPIPGMIAEEVAMAGIFVGAAFVAARCYGLSPWFCIPAIFAWAPAINSIEVAQNTGLTLLLVFLTILSLMKKNSYLAGLFVGLMLYKPTVALPLILLLAVRKEWKAVGVVAFCAAAWYIFSVPASAGDWTWPSTYLHTIHAWYENETQVYFKNYTIPSLLIQHGISYQISFIVGFAILVLTIPLLLRLPVLESASMVTLVGLTTSVHALPYEATLALPAVFYSMTAVKEPLRTNFIIVLYFALSIGLITSFGAYLLAIVLISGSAVWISSRRNVEHVVATEHTARSCAPGAIGTNDRSS